MYPFIKPAYLELSVDQRKELCSLSYRIHSALKPWNPSAKQTVLELLDQVIQSYAVIAKDISRYRDELAENNPLVWVPSSVLDFMRAYFNQFFIVRDRNLCLPKLDDKVVEEEKEHPARIIYHHSQDMSKGKIKAIMEETWWVVRVKSEYRMCRLTFDRGEYWEMVAYQGGKILNPQYRFPKYDNRVIYEFKEHITPDMFDSKIKEAIAIRKESLLSQANVMLEQFETVIIARHLTGGTLVGGVEMEDEDNWYLDTYDETGAHIFYDDARWVLEKKSRCTVVQILKRK